MNDETESPGASTSGRLGKANTAEASKAGSSIDRRRIILTTLTAAPIVTTLGVAAGKAQAGPKASTGASNGSSIKANKKN